jgi:tRNA dimethylallyltransferase
VRFLLVERDREDLRERIAANVAAMFDRGVEQEVAALAVEKIGPTAAMTLGIREIQSFLRGEIGRRETIDTITASTCRYAKRQLTWYRNQHDFSLLNLSRFSTSREMVEEAMRLLAAD